MIERSDLVTDRLLPFGQRFDVGVNAGIRGERFSVAG
jgi:hypothetical protein